MTLQKEVTLQKIVYVAWTPASRDRGETRQCLLGDCADAILDAGAARLQVNVADEQADLRAPGFGVLFERPAVATVNVWLESMEARHDLEDVLRRADFEIAGYAVEEQVYTDYGGNAHSGPRTWPDGERSPGVLAVTMMERPRRLTREEWIRRWHGRQSPMSEAMQPRTRYVRNVVERALTAGSIPFEGIVEEDWPSFRHVKNPFLFYGARGPFELVRNMAIMGRSVASFLDLWKIRTVMMSEYFVRSDGPAVSPRPS